jgi:hypothetical protein
VLCCKKPDEPVIEVIEKPLVFENLAACKCDTTPNAELRDYCKTLLSDSFVIKDVTGKLDYEYVRSIKPDYPMITNYLVDESRFPLWKEYRGTLLACIPNELLKLPTGTKVKFDCKLSYVPPYPKGMVIDYAGYPVELLRIEVVK